MATLEKIRNKAGILVAVVIGLALIAFILGDIFGAGPSLFTRTQFEVAEIAGKSIPYQRFQQKFDNLSEIYRLNTGQASLDSETNRELMEDAWELLLRDIIMEEEYDQIGLNVGTDELYDMIQGQNIHPIIRQLFTDPSTGMFDRESVTQFLRTMDMDPSGQQRAYWLYIEKEILRERKQTKYKNLLEKGIYVTSLEARNAFYNNNRRVDFEFITKRYADISDEEISISNSEIRSYYRRNRDRFSQEASRDIEYVTFDVVPSEADDREAQEWIENIRDEFMEVEAERLRQFVNINSDIPFDPVNYSDGELPEEINNFMFSAEPGDVYGPYYSDGAYRLARLAEINFLPDSVRARHILIQPGGELSYEEAREKSDSILNVITRGGSFEELAMEYSADGGSRFEGGDLGWFTEGVMIEDFSKACFEAETGERFIVETDFGFHVVEILNRSREVKKVRAAILAREVVPGSDTYQRIYRSAVEFASEADNYNEFLNTIEERGLTKRVAGNVRINDHDIPGLESPRQLIRWAFEAGEHSVSSIFELADRFVVAAVANVRREGTQPLDEVRHEIVAELTKEKKGEIISGQLNEEIEGGATFDELARSINSNIEQATGIRFVSFTVPSAGMEHKLIGAAISTDPGDMSVPVAGENGVYVLRVTDAYLDEEPDFDSERRQLANAVWSRVNMEAFDALKRLAEIKDNRYKFY